MDNRSRQPEKEKSPVQWHTLSEDLMNLDSEKTETPMGATVGTFSHVTKAEEPTGNQSTTRVSPGPVEKNAIPNAMPPKKRKKRRWPIVAAAIALLLIGGAVFAYFTVHQWTEPTCTTPSVCKICGKTGSPAAGHQWTPASCTAPKTCSVCHETEGVPLEHDLKDEVSYDFVKCTKESWKACSRCEYRTSSQSEQLTSFLDETKEFFQMSPNEFKERVEYLASQFDPAECTFLEDILFDDLKNVTFRWVNDNSSGSSTLGLPILECYAGSEAVVSLRLYDLNEDSVNKVDRNRRSSFNSVLMTIMSSSKKATSVYYSLELVLVAACDPEVDLYGVTAALLAGKANSGGRLAHNDLIYGASDIDYNIVTRKMVEEVMKQRS